MAIILCGRGLRGYCRSNKEPWTALDSIAQGYPNSYLDPWTKALDSPGQMKNSILETFRLWAVLSPGHAKPVDIVSELKEVDGIEVLETDTYYREVVTRHNSHCSGHNNRKLRSVQGSTFRGHRSN